MEDETARLALSLSPEKSAVGRLVACILVMYEESPGNAEHPTS